MKAYSELRSRINDNNPNEPQLNRLNGRCQKVAHAAFGTCDNCLPVVDLDPSAARGLEQLAEEQSGQPFPLEFSDEYEQWLDERDNWPSVAPLPGEGAGRAR